MLKLSDLSRVKVKNLIFKSFVLWLIFIAIGITPIFAQDCTVNKRRADRMAIRKVRLTGALDKSIVPCMTPSGVEKMVSIYLSKQLFPGISQPNNARIVADRLEPILEFMTEEGRQKVLDVISEYY